MKVEFNELIEIEILIVCLLYNFMVMPANLYVDCYLLDM